MADPSKDTCTGDYDAGKNWVVYDDLRQRFRLFVSDDLLFRRFVEFCNTKARRLGRLTQWQEKLWGSFVDHHPEFAIVNAATILEAFHICHVHMSNLRAVEIPIRKGVWDITHSSDYDARINEEAPYSESASLDSQAWSAATHVTVDRCDECFAHRKRIEGKCGT